MIGDDDDLPLTAPIPTYTLCVRETCPVQALGEHPLHEEDFPPERVLFGDHDPLPRLTAAELLERRYHNEPYGARLVSPEAERRHEIRLRSYRKLKAELVAQLGGCCNQCGAEEGNLDDQGRVIHLCFDHIHNDRTWKVRKLNRWTRIARYRREAAQGRIQLLCDSCNVRKENERRKAQKQLTARAENSYKSARHAR